MAIVYCKRLLDFEQWEGHPESPFRLKTMMKKLSSEGLWEGVTSPFEINDEDVLRVHTERHLDRLKKGGNVALDADTILWDTSYEYSMLSAGVACTAVSLAMDEIPAFALTRPPGHHAGRDFMGGFCYLNNVAIATARAGVRTAIVDIDAHHGNGTENIFYGRDDVLFIDIHEDGLFPGSGHMEDVGEGKGEGYTVNIPVPAGSGNRTYMKAHDEIVFPVLRQFRPELLVVSMGVDAHYCEKYSHINLNTKCYIDMFKKLLAESSHRKIAFVLEGGYHLRATAEVAAGLMAALEDREIRPEYNEERKESANGPRAVDRARDHHSRYWKL